MASSWTLITEGIAEDHFCRVVREDPNREGLLYLGTEFGIYLSFNGGEGWERFQLNSARQPDLRSEGQGNRPGRIATHGRSFWILDDLTVLHQYKDDSHR